MKLHRDDIIGQNLFTALGNGWVEINGRRHEGSLLVLPQHLAAWRPASFEQLSAEDFRPVIDQGCEILLFGSGTRQRFPAPALLQELMAARIGIETMDSAAACRTFNILVAEGRKVAAALIIERSEPTTP
jgi:uncharacterized protein